MKKKLLCLLLILCLLCVGLPAYAAGNDDAWQNASITGATAVDDSTLLMCDAWNKVVWRYENGRAEIFAGAIPVADLGGIPQGVYLDAAADQAYFKEPWDVVPFLDGYAVSDAAGNAIRYILNGNVYTLAGSGEAGDSDGEGADASFHRPTGLAVDEDGALYVADSLNGSIRRIAQDGSVTTWATGLALPTGLCWHGGMLFAAETGRSRIIRFVGNEMEVIAGMPDKDDENDEDPDTNQDADADNAASENPVGYRDGPVFSALFDHPMDVAVGADNIVYVADTLNGAVRKLQHGRTYTLLEPDGPSRPASLALTADGLWVGDAFRGGVSFSPVSEKYFEDIPSGAWFETSAQEITRRGFLSSMPDSDRFRPYAPVTRAMFLTMLSGLHKYVDGAAVIDGEPVSYEDVLDDWYTPAVRWAVELDITAGMSGVFLPNLAVSREQAVVMLLRYARSQGYTDHARAFLADYTDADQIDVWALEAMSWAAGAGLLEGDNGCLYPTAQLTRAEAAVLLHRFMDRFDL